MRAADIVIVGSGHGGAQAAINLRTRGFEGSILVVSRDQDLPYERPPLSKDYLADKKPFERLLIRPPAFWKERNVELRCGTTVRRVDPEAHTLSVSGDDEPIGYGTLIWAAGGDPRRLSCSGAQLAGVHALRDKGDTDRLRAQIAAGARRIVVVGGGYIGLEAAAVLTELGCTVTVAEMQTRLLSRVAGEALSAFYEAEHRARGVDVRLGCEITCIEGEEAVTGVRLDTDEVIPCEAVVVGIGIIPAVGPLIAAGAAGANGVDVDEFCRTSLPDIYAIGDCAAHANRYADGAVIRLESVQNAHDMAATAARSICGDPLPYEALPWFWSNQYDLRLQTAGLNLGHDTTVLRGNPAERSLSVLYLQNGRLIAVDAVNATKDYVQGRKLIEARATIDPEAALDAATPLASLL